MLTNKRVGSLQLVAGIVSGAVVVAGNVSWPLRIAWVVISLGMYCGAYRNLKGE